MIIIMWYEKLQKLKWEDGIIIVGIGMVAAGVGINLKSKVETTGVQEIKKTEIQSNSKVEIDVGGAVIHPGLYELNSGLRVNDALIAAGGLAAAADRDWVTTKLNKAELLKDGEKIVIPTKTLEKGAEPSVKAISKPESNLININTAEVSELDKLNGIGPAMAQRIVDYREKNGGFKNLEEIKLVSGIGDKLYEKIKDNISL